MCKANPERASSRDIHLCTQSGHGGLWHCLSVAYLNQSVSCGFPLGTAGWFTPTIMLVVVVVYVTWFSVRQKDSNHINAFELHVSIEQLQALHNQ